LTHVAEREIKHLQTGGFHFERNVMQFSIYSELQSWPGKSQKQA